MREFLYVGFISVVLTSTSLAAASAAAATNIEPVSPPTKTSSTEIVKAKSNTLNFTHDFAAPQTTSAEKPVNTTQKIVNADGSVTIKSEQKNGGSTFRTSTTYTKQQLASMQKTMAPINDALTACIPKKLPPIEIAPRITVDFEIKGLKGDKCHLVQSDMINCLFDKENIANMKADPTAYNMYVLDGKICTISQQTITKH